MIESQIAVDHPTAVVDAASSIARLPLDPLTIAPEAERACRNCRWWQQSSNTWDDLGYCGECNRDLSFYAECHDHHTAQLVTPGDHYCNRWEAKHDDAHEVD